MPAKKKSKAAPRSKKPRGFGKWEQVIAATTRALRSKKISSAKKIEYLERRAAAYKALGKFEKRAADIEMAGALRKTQVEESIQALAQARAEREILISIAQALVDQADLARIGEIVGEKVQKFFDAEIAAIGFYDEETGMISVPYYNERGRLKKIPPYRYGEGASSYAMKKRKPLYIPTSVEGRNKYGAIYGDEFPSETMLFTPILVGKKALGALTIQHSKPYAYSKHELDILTAIANSMAVALENARLFNETQKSNRETSEALELQTATSEILEAIASAPEDIDGVLHIIAEKAAVLSDSDDAFVAFVEDGFLKLRVHYGPIPFFNIGEGIRFDRKSVAGKAIIDGQPVQAIHNVKGKKSEFPAGDKVAKKFGYALTFATPLLIHGQTSGILGIRRIQPNLLSEKEISLLQNFANQVVIAFEKARLLNETKRLLEETTQRNAELAVINSVQEGLSRSLNLQEIVDLVGEKVGQIFKADTVVAALYDADRDWGFNAYYADRGRRIQNETLSDGPVIRPSLFALVVDSGKPLLIATAEESRKLGAVLQPPDETEEDQNESILFVPILAGRKVMGVLSVQSYQQSAYSEDDLRLLQTLAGSMSVALENARLFDETTQRNAELAVINSVQEGLSRSLNLQEIIDLVGGKVGEIFHADTVFAGLYDAARDWGSHIFYVDGGKRVPVADGPVIRPSLAAYVADTKKPLLLGTKEEGAKLGAVRVVRRKGEEDRNESVLGVPILKAKNVIGGISVQSYKRNVYTQDDLRLLQTLAGSMSVALQNAQLFDETSQRNAELAVINSVQEAMSRQLDIKGIYEAVGEKIKNIFHPEAMILGAFDLNASLVYPHYFYDKGERYFPDPFPFTGLIKHLVATQKSVVINEDFAEKQKEFGMRDIAGETTTRSGIFVPLVAGDKVIGAITLQSDSENAFSPSAIRLLETLANGMSVALENARLFDETAQRNAELAVINSAQEAMSKLSDIKGIYEAVGEKIKDIFQAQGVILGAFDHADGLVLAHYFSEKGVRYQPDPFPFSGLIKEMIARRKTIVINENFEAKVQEYGMTLAAGESAKSAVFVPLIAGEKVMGAISLQNIDREHAFSASDVRLLETLANSMSVALENARLFDETAQRNAELAVINSVQEGIASKLDVHAIYELVGEKLGQVFPEADVTVGRYDAATDMAIGEYVVEHGKRIPLGSFKVDGVGFIGELVRSPHTQVINENMEQALKEHGSRVITGTSMAKSFVNVPLVIDGAFHGLLQLQDMHKEHAFSDSDVRLLETIANTVSVALENARLFDETAQRNAELAVINSVQASLAEHKDIQGIYETVGQKLYEIFKTGVGIINYDLDAQTRTYVFSFVDGEREAIVTHPINDLHQFYLSQKSGFLHNDFHSSVDQFKSSPPFKVWPKSSIWVPLPRVGKQITAILLVDNERENAFNESDLSLLQTLASSMSVALESARLFDETTQRNAELSIINAVQEGLASKLEIGSIIDLVGGKLGEIFPDMDAVQINIYDQENDLIHIPYCVEKGLRHEHESRKPWGIRKLVLASRQAVVNNGPQDDGKLREMAEKFNVGEMINPLIAGEMPKSVLFVPLLVGDQVRGIISLQNMARENAFPDSTVQLLSTLANSMSVALENARLFNETERLLEESRKKEEELSTINTVSQAVASELELASLIELIGVQVHKIFKADIAYLALYDKEKDLIEFPYLFGDTLPPLKMGEGIVSRVIQERKPLLINRDQAWQEAEQKIERVGIKSLSYLGVPILVGTRVIGAISVQSTQKAGRFDEADQHLLSTIAANVGAAIENARLFAEVARQKEYFETFFQYSPAAVVVVDFNGKVISWNPAAQTLFGYTAQEAIGRDVDSLVASDPRVEAEARMYTKKFTGELGRVEVKGQRTRKDGSLVDVEVKGLPIAVEGKMVGLLVIYHDISEIEGARRAAEEANQAKSAFLANMSHELRTPLNAIIGFTRIVRRKGEAALPEKQLENLDKVLVSAEHLLGLINTILDIAKIEAGRMELQLSDFNLDALVDGCLATTQPLLKLGVPLISSLPPQLPQMHSDEEKIRQVLLNLLSNAAKFTHHGSIRVNGEMKGEMISLAVQDTGIGIAPENLNKIFEEFQQADTTTTREYGGTGLGLSISRSLAKLLGGDLTVASVEGQGSTFTLTLPRHLGPVTAVASDGKDEIAAPSLDPDKPIVLVIDDQPDMFHILHQNLGDAGYQVIGALSGEEGIEKARSLHPFAITLDIMMPRKDGWQVLYELKNDPETKNIPVIILTIVDNKPMGFRLGASDYLVKPLSEKSVLDALERLAKSNGGVHPHKLLVVDDDPKVADLVQQTLEGDDFVIETSGDGAQALSHILLSKPDAILLDLLMPRMDGFQFIEELRKHPQLRAIPIIVLTAKSLSNDEQAQLENSVAKIIKKQGLGSETLVKEIHQLFPSPESA